MGRLILELLNSGHILKQAAKRRDGKGSGIATKLGRAPLRDWHQALMRRESPSDRTRTTQVIFRELTAFVRGYPSKLRAGELSWSYRRTGPTRAASRQKNIKAYEQSNAEDPGKQARSIGKGRDLGNVVGLQF